MAEINIKPEREYLHEIVSKIKKGIYGVPSFQRILFGVKNKY